MRWCRKRAIPEFTETPPEPTAEEIAAVDAARGELVRRRVWQVVVGGVLIAVVFQLMWNWDVATTMAIEGFDRRRWDWSLGSQSSDAIVFATTCAVFVAAIAIAVMTTQPASGAGFFDRFGQARWRQRAADIAAVGAALSFALILPAWAHSFAIGLALAMLAILATGLAAITVVAAVPPIERVESEKRQRVLEAMDARMVAYPRKGKAATRATARRNVLLGMGLLALQVAAATALSRQAPIIDPSLASWGVAIGVMLYVSSFSMVLYGLAFLGLVYLRWEAVDRGWRRWQALVTVGIFLLFVSAFGYAVFLLDGLPAFNVQTFLWVAVIALWWPIVMACAHFAEVRWRVGPLAALRHAAWQSRAREAERAEKRAADAEDGQKFLLD